MFVGSEARWLCDSWAEQLAPAPLMACAGCNSNCNSAPGAARAHISHWTFALYFARGLQPQYSLPEAEGGEALASAGCQLSQWKIYREYGLHKVAPPPQTKCHHGMTMMTSSHHPPSIILIYNILEMSLGIEVFCVDDAIIVCRWISKEFSTFPRTSDYPEKLKSTLGSFILKPQW